MIFLSNAAGEITAAIPETINQGSVGVNKIVLIAPFPANSVVSATFTLPNGIKIYPRYVDGVREENYHYLMGVVEAFGDKGLVIDGVTVNAWQLTLDKAITQIAGKVTVQFLVTGSNGTLTTTSATLPINRGNAYISPSVDPSQYELIQQYLAAAQRAQENAEAAEDSAKEQVDRAKAEADRAEAAAESMQLNADRYSPWDIVVTYDNVLDVLEGLSESDYKSILFLGIDFSSLNLERFTVNGVVDFIFSFVAEKIEFRGCNFDPIVADMRYSGSQCSITGAKGDEIVIQGFTDVIDCRAKLIQDCEYVTACDAVTIDDCESVTDTTAENFIDCIFVDPFTVIGFVPSTDVGKVATLTDDGTYKPERLAKTIRAVVNPNNFKINIAIDDVNGIGMSEAEIDLPLESVVVGATVSDDGTTLILTLQNGNTVDVPLPDVFRGVATEEYVNNRVQEASDILAQQIDNLPSYDVATAEVNLDYQQAYLKLTIDNLLDGNYDSFQPFDMVCVGNDEYPLSSICTVTVESYDAVKMLVYNTEGAAETLCPKYHTNEDGNVYLYFSIAGIKHFQVFIRGLVEKCTGATLEIIDALPTYPLDIIIEKHLNEDYVSYTANGVTQKRPIGNLNTPYSIVCRTSSGGINVRTPASGAVYSDTEAVNYKYIRDVMLPEALANAGGGSGNANIDVTAEVGQTIIVKEVDANGKPTKWESADYQERICWTDETVVLPETTVEVDAEEGLAPLPEFTLVGGDKYTIKYNGFEYVCECVSAPTDETFYIGNLGMLDESIPDTGEPFIIASEGGVQFLFPFDGATTVTVSITETVVTPIPQKYVTNAFPYYVDIIEDGGDKYVNETVANLEAMFKSGREIKARNVYISGGLRIPRGIVYSLVEALPAYNSIDAPHIFKFCSPISITAFAKQTLTPNEDGTYTLS
jgi:hypothetical protein